MAAHTIEKSATAAIAKQNQCIQKLTTVKWEKSVTYLKAWTSETDSKAATKMTA